MEIIIVLSASGTHQPTIFVLLGNYRTSQIIFVLARNYRTVHEKIIARGRR